MNIVRSIALLAAALVQCLWAAPSAADGPVEASQAYIRDAGAAYRNGDIESYVTALEAAYALNPASLSTRYNLACGYARSGRADEALDLLAELVAERVDFGLADDPDLDNLRGLDRFGQLLATLERVTRPTIASEPFLAFEQYGLAPEGIAHDPTRNRFFFGSMRTGEIYVVDGDSRVSRFASVDPEGRLSAVGMTVDVGRGLLWAVGATFDLAENADNGERIRSGLFGFDLESGALRRTYRVPQEGEVLNDVTIGPRGRLFATGSGVYVADERDERLRRIETTIEVFGSNGIVVTPDGESLIVTSYPVGLFAIDIPTGAAQALGKPDGVTLYGIDGLYWHEGALIGVQNGARPWRLVRFHLDEALTAVTAAEIIEMNNEATTPMTGAIVDDAIYYIGESRDPEPAPSQFPESLHRNLGAVLIRKAELGSP